MQITLNTYISEEDDKASLLVQTKFCLRIDNAGSYFDRRNFWRYYTLNNARRSPTSLLLLSRHIWVFQLNIIKIRGNSTAYTFSRPALPLQRFYMSIVGVCGVLSEPRRGKARKQLQTQTVQWETRRLSQKAVIRLEL